jgi:hypothetical protein
MKASPLESRKFVLVNLRIHDFNRDHIRMKVDDIISYGDLVAAEKANLQKGMNFGNGHRHSVFLMSVRRGAPYADSFDSDTGTLIYEGHDEPQTASVKDPKIVDQPLTTKSGGWTENGKFFRAAMDFKSGLTSKAHLIRVYARCKDCK